MIRIGICDDKSESREIIKNEISKAKERLRIPADIIHYENGRELLDSMWKQKRKPDILFLDIDMPDISGLEVADHVRKMGNEVIIIFISAHDEYVFESIKYRPFRYIRKVRMQDEIEPALKAAYISIRAESKGSIEIKTEDGKIGIKRSDIMYYEMVRRRIVIHTKDKMERTVLSRITIKDFTEKIDDPNFVRVHSGCVVNVKYIHEYSDHSVTLDDGEELIVSRTRISEVKSSVMKYWRDKV